MIRIIILTTDTSHHRYFVAKLCELYPVAAVVIETEAIRAPFEIVHSFERARDQYEIEYWGREVSIPIHQRTEVVETKNINDALVLKSLQELSPDLLIDFGTSRVRSEIFSLPVYGTWNLHGGNPEEYRGLDTHLWAIYHGDFSALVTTLHRLEKELDTGEIISQAPIPLYYQMPLYELRAKNTEVCVSLVCDALTQLTESHTVSLRPQTKKGRYYSFMPTVLKEGCVAKFQKHTNTLS